MFRASIASFLLLAAAAFPASAAEKGKVVTLNTAWMPEHESFIPWYAKQKGWDKEEGFSLEMHYFDSGMAQLEALPAKQWTLGGTGGVPAVVGALRYESQIIGVGNDESITNVVMVRANSPLLQQKGKNPKYPDVYGTAELVKGKTILVTTVSSAHYAMSLWLRALGLKDSDVVVKNMDQAQAVSAFESGIGDAVVLWAPHIYTGQAKGWKIISDIKGAGAALPIVLIGEKAFCEKNPEIVAGFLRMYMRGINLLKKEGAKLAPEYRRFLKEFGGLEITEEVAKKDIEMHPVFAYDEQLKLLDASNGPSQVQKWEMAIADFFTEQGRFKPAEKEKIGKTPFITDKYMKMVKQPIPGS